MNTRTASWSVFDRFDERRLLLLVSFLPLLAFFVVVWLVPIGYALWMSLFTNPIGAPTFVGLGNYLGLL